MNIVKTFSISLKDFFTFKFITLSFLPFAVAVFWLAWLLYFGGEKFIKKYENFSTSYPFINKFFKFDTTEWFVEALYYTFGTFLVILVSLIIASIVVCFLTPVVTKEINKRHYNLGINNNISFARVLFLMFKEILKFILLCAICLPLMFVPVVNFVFINLPFLFLYYKFMFLDVSSNALSKEKFEIYYKKSSKKEFLFLVFIFYAISLIPFLGLFLQIFFVINFTHLVFQSQCIDLNQSKFH